jgi:hypothetical protein
MHCLNCKTEIKTGKYCSNKCQGDKKSRDVVENWLKGSDHGYKVGYRIKTAVRKYMLEQSNFQCVECGWNKINPKTGNSPLEIDHIDGDCSNCKKENLKVLCPNCHSLTETWKALNKGKGNRERHKYSGLIGA